MSDNRLHTVFFDAPPHNRIGDKDVSISYGDLPAILLQLDAFFSAGHKRQLHCLAIRTENNALIAGVIIYLLSKNINFLLLPVNQAPPAFCDAVLTFRDNRPAGVDPHRSMEILPNHLFNKAVTGMQPASGLVLFTSSGTSGRPKYVCFQQQQLIRNAANCRERFRYNPDTKVLIPVPVGHMYGMGAGLLPAMLAGANIFLTDRSNIVKLYESIKQFQPDIVLITPVIARMMLLLDKPVAVKTTCITAGEIIKPETFKQFENKFGCLINLYGSTEQGAIATSPVDETDSVSKSEGILQPLPQVAIKIDGEEKGEILCRHNAPFHGYVDEHGYVLAAPAEATSWYSTSDVACDTGNGYFKIMGRKDNCINRSGFLVSLEKIEETLEDLFKMISKAVVFELDNNRGLSNRLIAVCEVQEDDFPDHLHIKETCRLQMTRHQVPDEFYFIRNMARLHNGKPDRQFLMQHYQTLLKN